MTDRTPTDDELVSSYLDGEATPEEAERVETEPALAARVEELRAASRLVATPVAPLSAADTNRLIGAALDLSATSDDVIDLTAQTRHRQRVRQRLVTVAAGVLVLGLAVPLLFAISGSGDDVDTASIGVDESLDRATDDASGGDQGDLGFAEEPAAEEMTAEMAPADEFPDDMEDAEGEADMGAAEPAADGATDVDDATNRLGGAFLLPGGLGPYASEAELVEELTGIWEDRDRVVEPEELPASTTTTMFAAIPCGREFLEYFAGTDALADLTVVVVGGEEFTAALVDLGDGDAVIALAAHADCVVDDLAELTGAE